MKLRAKSASLSFCVAGEKDVTPKIRKAIPLPKARAVLDRKARMENRKDVFLVLSCASISSDRMAGGRDNYPPRAMPERTQITANCQISSGCKKKAQTKVVAASNMASAQEMSLEDRLAMVNQTDMPQAPDRK